MDPRLEKKLRASEEERIGCRGINPKYCRSCRFSRGTAPFENGPEKAYCMIFSRNEGEAKPPEVYYDGEPCEFYEKDKR